MDISKNARSDAAKPTANARKVFRTRLFITFGMRTDGVSESMSENQMLKRFAVNVNNTENYKPNFALVAVNINKCLPEQENF